jgi:hypothetical protein
VLREVQDFARRRPGAFLATALAAGFVVGRLGKVVAKADSDAGVSKPGSDSFVSGQDSYTSAVTTQTTVTTPPPVTPAPGYATGTDEYATGPGYASTTEYTSTGTGTPTVREEYVVESPERLR